jgi:hypothetical protein
MPAHEISLPGPLQGDFEQVLHRPIETCLLGMWPEAGVSLDARDKPLSMLCHRANVRSGRPAIGYSDSDPSIPPTTDYRDEIERVTSVLVTAPASEPGMYARKELPRPWSSRFYAVAKKVESRMENAWRQSGEPSLYASGDWGSSPSGTLAVHPKQSSEIRSQ